MLRGFKILAVLFLCVISGYALGSFAHLLRFPGELRLTEYSTYSVNIAGWPRTIQTGSRGSDEMVIAAFGVPLRRIALDVVPEMEVVPLGVAIGVRINTDGVMVLGTNSFQGESGETFHPAADILHGGDLILRANDVDINNKEELSDFVAESTGEITFLVRRDDAEFEINITPEIAAKDGVRRIGVWVRDSTKGIGTLTFFCPETSEFGALGHGILDVDTKTLLSVRSGRIMPSTVTSVTRGVRGVPGELEGMVDTAVSLGTISTNCTNGIFGTLNAVACAQFENLPRYPIANRTQIREGPATVLTNVSGTEVKSYEIEIESINLNPSDETKGFVIRITDDGLLRQTGGIVQGMSGSPILQNGHVIGAITHVFVQDPARGYCIFIESMIRYCQIARQLPPPLELPPPPASSDKLHAAAAP
ncbi:MAG: SpoIVB peptidase [Defluviitaleaceae bacterium]|nr:SpoIVB peptidase [Defluviitaleaceae bacterium]